MADDKVVLVTAGGSGMGAACARHLAGLGWRVGILSSSGKGEALAAELGGVGVTGSNQNEADLKRAVDAVMDRWGRIDGLVNSAGHGPRAPILEISDADWLRGMEVYFLNVVRALRLVTPIIAGAGRRRHRQHHRPPGRSSRRRCSPPVRWRGRGWRPLPRSIATTYAAKNIRMNNVAPGWIDSLSGH